MNRDKLEKFARTFFTTVDAQNADGLRPYVTDDIRLQMANMEATAGVGAMMSAFRAAEERFASITHHIQGIWTGLWENGPVVSVEAIARYGFKDGRKIELPVTSTLRLTSDGKVADYRIFMDPGPTFA